MDDSGEVEPRDIRQEILVASATAESLQICITERLVGHGKVDEAIQMEQLEIDILKDLGEELFTFIDDQETDPEAVNPYIKIIRLLGKVDTFLGEKVGPFYGYRLDLLKTGRISFERLIDLDHPETIEALYVIFDTKLTSGLIEAYTAIFELRPEDSPVITPFGISATELYEWINRYVAAAHELYGMNKNDLRALFDWWE